MENPYWNGSMVPFSVSLWYPGARFINVFSIAIQIRWKFRFTLTAILIQWSLQNLYMHDSCAVVACAKICCDLMASNGVMARRSFHRIWIAGRKMLVKQAPASNEKKGHLCFRIFFSLVRYCVAWPNLYVILKQGFCQIINKDLGYYLTQKLALSVLHYKDLGKHAI